MRLWHARRAVPWPVLGICLGLAAAGAALVRWQERAGFMVLPLITLLTAAGAAYVLDDSAAEVTRVTARGSRWAAVNRLSVAALISLAGVGLVALARGEVGGLSGWPMVGTTMALAVVAVAAWAVRNHHRTPGTAIASTLILLGIMPFVTARLFSGAWPYPSPELTDAARDRWLVVAALAAGALVWAVLRPLPRQRARSGPKVPADSKADAPIEARGGVPS